MVVSTMENERFYVPDTSVVIEGIVSDLVAKGKIKDKVLIHHAVVAELEHQANYGREVGFLGLDEIKKLREICRKKNIGLEFSGMRPNHNQIRHATHGEIDAMIRDLAWGNDGILITADKVQAQTADALGIETMFIETKKVKKELLLAKFFDQGTMSVHIKEGIKPYAKNGKPGNWKFVPLRKVAIKHEEVVDIAKNIVEFANMDTDSFVEIDRKGSSIVQIKDFRIVICRPPFSDGMEITAVKPVVNLELEDYNLDEKLIKRLQDKAEGVLISGSPGMGKTTFAQALAKFYNSTQKTVKTIEAPRDLQLPDEVTQYSKNFGSSEELHDILLLSRPDYTIFDEMRNTSDFRLYADLRLSGVGMVGVIHGTTPIDAVQRFIGRIELGMIPSVLDTVIFIKDGEVNKIYSLNMVVKVPSGMVEADLARPVVEVKEFISDKLEYEMYSFGEETVVVPVSSTGTHMSALAKKAVEDVIRKYAGDADVRIINDRKVVVYVEQSKIPRLIGKDGRRIDSVEKELGVSIDVRNIDERDIETKADVQFRMKENSNNIVFSFDKKLIGNAIDFYLDERYIFSATVGKRGEIRLNKDSESATLLIDGLDGKAVLSARV
jgi:ATPase